MTEQPTVPVPEVPETGHDEIDAALASLRDLEQGPVSDHHDELRRVHEVLHGALDEAAGPRR